MTDVHTPPKRWPQWLGFALIALLLSGLVVQERYSQHNSIAANEIARMQTLARLSEASLKATLNAIDNLMIDVRDEQLQSLRQGHAHYTNTATPALIHLAATIPGVRTLSLSNAVGLFIASSRSELIGVDASNRAYFNTAQSIKDPKVLIISEPFFTRLNAYSIQLVRPILDAQGQFHGMVTVTLDPSFYATLLSTSVYAEDLRCLLIHEDGVVFQAAGDFKPAPGINLNKPGSLLRIHKNSGQIETLINHRSYSTGDPRMGVLRTLESTVLSTDKKLVIAFTRNTDKVFLAWRNETLAFAALLALLLGMGAGGLAVYQRRGMNAWRLTRAFESERLQVEQQRAQATREIEDLYNHAPCGYHSLDAQGLFVRINQTELDWLGLTRDQVIGQLRFIDLLGPEDADKFRRQFPQFLASGQLENMEFTLKDSHGQDLVVLANATAVRDAEGKFLFSRTTLSDITERKHLETVLKDKTEQLETILNNASISISMLRDRQTIWVNPASCALFGYSFEEFVGMPTEMLYPSREQYLATGEKIYPDLATGKTVVKDIEFKRKDGALIWGRATLRVVQRQGGERATIALIEDITQRKQAEQTIHELMSLIEESPDFIATAGLDKVVSYMNPAALEMLGHPAGTPAHSIRISETHPAWVNDKMRTEVFPAVHAQGSWRGELAFVNLHGQEFPVFQTVLLHRDEHGLPSHLSTIARDISKQKHAEQVLLEATLAAEAATRAKSQFISNMSHDIRTPLSALLTYGHLLLDAPLGPKHREQLQRLNVAGDALLGLVNDILDFSKIEAGELHLANEPTDLQRKLDELQQVMDVIAIQKGLTLIVEPMPTALPTHFMCDPLRLRQILINLVGNALKFTHQGSVTVRILALPTVEPEHQRLRLEVIDTGIGISTQDQGKLFNRFSQVDEGNTRRYGGSGLGLAIVKELAECMGGQVDVHSEPGQGSTFGVEMLLQRADPTDIRQAVQGQAQATAQEQHYLQLDGLRILVVDDSDTNLDIAEQLLSAEGALVITRGDGLQALELLRSDAPLVDIVLMDVQMPVMDGNTAIAWMRQEPRLQTLPVITMTAGATRSDRELSLQAGANDYVTKPFVLLQLIRTIRHQLEQQRGQALPMGRVRAQVSGPLASSADQNWPEVKGLDLDSVRELMSQDWRTYSRHASQFLREHARWAQLSDWPTSEAAQAEATSALHKIVGEAGLLGAMDLMQRARAAEQLARQPGEKDMSVVLQAFAQEMLRVQAVLTPILAKDDKPASSASMMVPLDLTELQALMDDLNAQRFKAFKRFQGLQAALATRLPAPEWRALTEVMEHMDFAKAIALLAPYASDWLPPS